MVGFSSRIRIYCSSPFLQIQPVKTLVAFNPNERLLPFQPTIRQVCVKPEAPALDRRLPTILAFWDVRPSLPYQLKFIADVLEVAEQQTTFEENCVV